MKNRMLPMTTAQPVAVMLVIPLYFDFTRLDSYLAQLLDFVRVHVH